MDRRQKKTRESIFAALCTLLSKKHYNQITVAEIIELANIGRATFYAHFETKDFLLKALCEELFCHIFDCSQEEKPEHQHIFSCDSSASPILHLFQHLQKNDNNILRLLHSQNNELFLGYFKANLKEFIKSQLYLFEEKRPKGIPESFWVHHICATLVETVRWWVQNGMRESPEELYHYFITVI